MQLDTLLSYPRALPAIPRAVNDLLVEMNQAEPSEARVSKLISQDPALTIRVLRLANSAFFQASRKVGCVEEAVTMLGMTHVRSLVTAAALGASFRSVQGVDLDLYWRFSLRAAEIARSLAEMLGQDAGNAFTAGLTHRIGVIVMHIAMPNAMAPLNMSHSAFDMNRAAAEKAAFGYSFADVGAGLAEKWLFPAEIVSALYNQAEPFEGATYDVLGGILHLAAWRAKAEEIGLDDKALAATFPDMVGLTLGLDLNAVMGKTTTGWTYRQMEGATAEPAWADALAHLQGQPHITLN